MRTSMLLAFAATLAAGASASGSIADPGFEAEGAAGALSSWSDCGGTPAAVGSATVHGGRYAVTLAGEAAICQRVVLPMARSILLDFWARAVPSGADASGTQPPQWNVSFFDRDADGTLELVRRVIGDVPLATHGFQHFTFDVTPLAGQPLVVSFAVHRAVAGAGASVVLDDVTLLSEAPIENRS